MGSKVAEVKLACGRLYLDVAGLAIAMETDVCRDVTMASLAKEEEFLMEDGVRTSRLRWNKRLLELAADKINAQAKARIINWRR